MNHPDLPAGSPLNPGTLALIALANEYCQAAESARDTSRAAFTATMTRLLPRLYMAAADVIPATTTLAAESDESLLQALDEEAYETVRGSICALMADADTYLETFEEDMKYSDTPIGATVSENLADIYQELYNFVATVRDLPPDMIPPATAAVKADFEDYWSQTLCNVLRPLNHLRYSGSDDE